MSDAQSTIVGLKAQDCPGGGWNGMPDEMERATVADCLAHDACGCIYGDAVQHIERLRAELDDLKSANALLHGLISNRDADIERLRRELNLLRELHHSAEKEVNELRAALQEIKVLSWTTPEGHHIQDIARRALEGK